VKAWPDGASSRHGMLRRASLMLLKGRLGGGLFTTILNTNHSLLNKQQ
jgi:hypothetical protein